MPLWIIVLVALAYVLLLFAIAWWSDRQARRGRNLAANSLVYTLSLAVYCTTGTLYGGVGRAASVGVGFLSIYLGPTLMMTLGFVVLRKILRIAKRQRTTSIADFIAARYGRSQVLGALVALVAVIGIIPYIALQLKGVSASFDLLAGFDPARPAVGVLLFDSAVVITLLMAAFTILFGTRQIDAAEHHPGVMAAVAFESVVKLAALLAVGLFVAYYLFDGFGDLFDRARRHPEIAKLFTAEPALGDGSWITVTVLAMLAVICLPRQFQMAIIENVDERHLARAMWLFPLYLLLINVFVLPLAVAGLLLFPAASIDRDMVVLALPLAHAWPELALFVFIGGLSAGTAMIVVETIALSTMVSNDLVLPLLLRRRLLVSGERADLGRTLLAVRRIAVVVILLLGYLYFRVAGGAYALLAIALISFAAVAQFAPALIGGAFWAGASRRGALAGLGAGTLVWAYTLLLPSFARSGWIPASFIEQGPWGLALLRPYALFGLDGLDPLSHTLFWSALANIGLFVGVSLLDHPDAGERAQATAFVEVFRQPGPAAASAEWRSGSSIADLHALLARFLGPERTDAAFADYARQRGAALDPRRSADADLILFAERLLAGMVGAASARVALTSGLSGGGIASSELMRVLDETSQAIEYSRQLEQKSAELERASAALRAANERLRELDHLKDEFLSTVTHELRTPLTAVRALSELLQDNPDMELEERQHFLGLIVKESERLSRLINEVLDMAKIEAGQMEFRIGPVDLETVMNEAIEATSQLFRSKEIAVERVVADGLPPVRGDRDRLMQVAVNLLSNAAKFTPPGGRVEARLGLQDGAVRADVRDNGVGILPEDLDVIFEKFRQGGNTLTDKPTGTGLGLAVCRRIVEHLHGRIWVESKPGEGATFSFTVPTMPPESRTAERTEADAIGCQ